MFRESVNNQIGKTIDEGLAGSGKIRRVMWGREERPLTVFVPWDCGHHCPFCTTKHEYETKYPAEKLDYFFARQKESLRRMLEYGFVDSVVFTGGEPLADLARLDELVEIARQGRGDIKIFVNTSLNLTEEQETRAIEYLRVCGAREDKVNGISVSLPYADVEMFNARGYAALTRLMRMQSWPYNFVRVNSVIRGNEGSAQIRKFVSAILATRKEFGVWSINFRKDYTECTQANLNDCRDPFLSTLMGMEDFTYQGHGGCLVCRNDVFWPRDDLMHRVTYHRGVESTSLRYGEFLVINDFVIKQDGEIRYDWTKGTLLPKCVMDALAGELHSDQSDWKWKNPDFSHSLVATGSPHGMTCRDVYSVERCG